MSDRAAKLRLGGFVATALAGLTGLVVLFGGTPQLFQQRAKYVIVFSEAPGLQPGTPVRKSGVRIGEVNSLDLDEQSGQVKVAIQVEKKYLPRQNEEATIFRGLLSGDTSLDFIPKVAPDGLPITARGEVYSPESEILGQTPINPNQLVRQASGVLPSAQESMARMLATIQRFEQAVPKIERAFDEIAGLARSGRELVPELKKTNEKVQALLSFNDPQPPPPGGAGAAPVPVVDMGGLKTTLNEIREFVKTTRPLVDDVRKLIKDNEADINGTLKAVRRTAEGVNSIVNEDNTKAIGGLLKNLQLGSDDLAKTIRLAALLLDTADKAVRDITTRLPNVDRVLKTTEGAIQSAEATFKTAEQTVKDLSGTVKDVSKDLSSTVKSAQGAIQNIETATRPFAENAEPIVKNIGVVSEQLARTLGEVRETLRIVNRSDGTLQKVLTDPALYQQLNDSAVSLTRTLMRAEKVAADLQVFADKIARRPEMIGVGGAVRPSAGLKESPTAATPERPIAPVPFTPTTQPLGPVIPAYRQPLLPRATSDLPPR